MMKRVFLTLTLLLYFFCFQQVLSAQNKEDASFAVDQLLASKNCFDLQRIYQRSSTTWDAYTKLRVQCVLERCFGELLQAIESINELLHNFREQLNEHEITNQLKQLAVLYVEVGDYSNAARIYNHLLDPNYNLYNHLTSVSSMQVILPSRDTEIKFQIDSLNTLLVPVTIKSKSFNFVFDTGNTACLVNATHAKEIGLRMLDDSVFINNRLWAKVAILDTMKLNDIVFANVLFYVLPTLQFNVSFALSLPVIKALQVISIDAQENKITITKKDTSQRQEKNMAIIDNQLYIEAKSGFERLVLRFDTGDNGASLNSNYFNKHQSLILSQGILTSNRVVHAGGVNNLDGYLINNVPFALGSYHTFIPSIFVESVKQQLLTEDPILCDGSMGMLLFQLTNKITINFNQMWISIDSNKTN